MRDDYAVFILSHGRADNVKTFKTLKRQGYTGDIFFILDNEDETADEYIERFGKERIIIFDKKATAKYVDTADLSDDNRAVVFARNVCFDIANIMGLKYFLMLDDDYQSFSYRYEEGRKLRSRIFKNLDKLFSYMFDFLDDTGALTVALAQGGDFMGGVENDFWRKRVRRKAMNTFFCNARKPFEFSGRINEDVNMYTLLGNRGELIFSVADANIVQTETQKASGGLTDIYLDLGTYVKSFYSVIFSPQCVKIAPMGRKNFRVHHAITWDKCTPKIISDKYKRC